MNLPGRALAAAGLAVLAALSAGCSAAGSHPAETRNFTLPALADPARAISLAGYADKPVILTFFASWCPPCRANAELIASFYRMDHRQAAIIGIDSNDTRAGALHVVRASQVTFPVATDPTIGTAVAFGAPGLPATYFLNAQHRVLRRVFGVLTWQQLTSGAAMSGSPVATSVLGLPISGPAPS